MVEQDHIEIHLKQAFLNLFVFMKKYPERYNYLLEIYKNPTELTIEHMQKTVDKIFSSQRPAVGFR